MKDHKIARLVMAALFAAFACVATMCIRIPTPITGGYVNVGDMVVLLSAWLLGGPYSRSFAVAACVSVVCLGITWVLSQTDRSGKLKQPAAEETL